MRTSKKNLLRWVIMLLPMLTMAFGLYGQANKAAPSTETKEPILCIKFKDDLPIYVLNGKLTDRGAGIVASLGLFKDAGTFEKMITSVSESKLDSMRVEAQAYWNKVERQNTGIIAGTIADMNNYIALKIKPGLDVKVVEAGFRSSAYVEHVDILPELAEPPVPPNFVPQQNYMSTSTGINAEQVYTTYNNHGAGVQVVDIEGSFNSNHKDLPNIPLVINVPMEMNFGNNHGTSVLGQMVSKNNGWGTSGIAYDSPAKFAVRGTYYPNTILASANAIQPGDVILLELQLPGPNGEYVPIEYIKANYDAIKMVTGNNRVVVEAAGNGGENLDVDIIKKGNAGHYPFHNDHNSGAIIVGAGTNNPNTTPRSRLNFSCYGSRVNVQAFGENVITTGGDITYVNGVQTSIPPVFYPTEGVDYYYTNKFGGTSGASPIVAGACLLIQSVLKNNTNTYLTSLQMQQLLMGTGKPQQGNVAENIGPLPDAYKAIQTLLNSSSCNAPLSTQMTVTNLTSTAATLQCTAANAQAYKWAYRKVGVTSWTALAETTTGISQVTGLQANKQYEFVVKIRCNATTWSGWSAAKTFTTPTTATCTAPTTNQLSATNITTTSASLNCSVGGMQSYDWNVRAAGASTWNTLTATSTGIKNITGLQAASNYEYRVRVRCNATTWSDWSSTKTFTTANAVSCNPPAPTQISTSSIMHTSAVLNCTVPGALAYDWKFRLVGGTWFDLDQTNSGSSDLFLLNSGTSYEFAVRVKCTSTTWSDWSAGKIFTTLSCSTPSTSQLFATNITYTSATLNCSLSGGQYYDWAYRINNGAWISLDATLSGVTSISDLLAGTTYQFAVAVSCDGNTWTNWVYKTFTTPTCVAPTGAQVWYSNLSSSSVEINCSKTGVQAYESAISVYNSGNWEYFISTYSTVLWYNLQSNTLYAYAVRVSCDGINWSNWSPTESFVTYNFAGTDSRDATPKASINGIPKTSPDQIGSVYPNPTNDEAVVDILQTTLGSVKWELVDQLGKLIVSHDENMEAGNHQILIRTDNLASGIYTLKVQTQASTRVQQLSVVR